MSNQFQDQYEQCRKQVISYLGVCIQSLQAWGIDCKGLVDLKKRVENHQFSIVVVGEFSSGKSMFLNALMHKTLLPSFSGEATATVNYLHSKDCAPGQVAGIVYYKDGTKNSINALTKETIEAAVSVRGDREGKKIADVVDHVDLYLDSPLLNNGVVLIDSPGLNGTREKHRQITFDEIKRSHICIYMFNAEHPGERTDFDALHDIQKENDNVFYVLNQIDVVHEEEGETPEMVIDTIEKAYEKEFPDDHLPEIWPISAKMALTARDCSLTEWNGRVLTDEMRAQLEEKSRLPILEERMVRYLTQGERTRDELVKPITQAMNAVRMECEQAQNILDSLKKDNGLETLQEKQQKLETTLQEAKGKQGTISPEVREGITKLIRELRDTANTRIDQIQDEVNEDLKECDNQEDLKNYDEQLDSMLRSRFQRIGRTLSQQFRDDMMDLIRNAYDKEAEGFTEKMESDTDQGNWKNAFQFQSSDIKINYSTLSIDIEQFHNQIAELQQEKKQLNDEINSNRENRMRAIEKEDRTREIEESIQYYQQMVSTLQSDLSIPEIRQYQEEEEEYVDRRGFLGKIGQFFVGPRRKKTIVTRNDSTEHDAAIARRDEQISQYSDEIKKQQAKKEKIRETTEHTSQYYTDNENRLIELRQEQERREEELIEQHNTLMDTENAKACRKDRKALQNKVMDCLEENRTILMKCFRDAGREYSDLAQAIINQNITAEINRIDEQLKQIIETLKLNSEKRENEVRFQEKIVEEASKLYEQGTELTSKLETQMNYQIKEDNETA